VRAKEIVSERVRENEKRVYLGFQEKEIERRKRTVEQEKENGGEEDRLERMRVRW
jgi:hypothetical protein